MNRFTFLHFIPSFSDCDDPIGLERSIVPSEAFTASSWYDVDHEPWLARLYSKEGEGAWCAQENDGAQYLQVDLGQIHIVTGVAVQGKYEISEWAMRFRAWVTNFSLSFSNDQITWTSYIEDGNTPKVRISADELEKEGKCLNHRLILLVRAWNTISLQT